MIEPCSKSERRGSALAMAGDSAEVRRLRRCVRGAQEAAAELLVELKLEAALPADGDAAADRAAFQREAAREQLEAGRRAVLREVRAQHLAVGQGAAQLSATAAAERADGERGKCEAA